MGETQWGGASQSLALSRRFRVHGQHLPLADAIALRGRVMMLADATDWRARGAEGYRAGVAALQSDLDRLVQAVAASDDGLAAAQRETWSAAPFTPMGW